MSASLTTQVRFRRALAVARALPDRSALQPTAEDKLNLYGLYKQATLGDCSGSRPSPRQMVSFAKWQAWECRRDLNPVQAQRMYVHALTALLIEFIHRYPRHEEAPALTESLAYLEGDIRPEEKEASTTMMWEPEKEEYYLGHIGPYQLQDYNTSPTTYYPGTPDMSPAPRLSLQKMARSNGFRPVSETPGSQAVPYAASITTPSPSHPHVNASSQYVSSSDRALENLQTQVAALSEQIDMLKRSIAEQDEQERLQRWSLKRLLRSMAKHALVNSLILLIVFLILWQKRSPFAYAIIAYVRPQLKDMTQYVVGRIVFWKVSV